MPNVTGCHGSCHGSMLRKGPSLLVCHGVTGSGTLGAGTTKHQVPAFAGRLRPGRPNSKWRPLRPGVFALNADGMAGPAGDSSDHAVGPNKVYDPPSLGSFRRRWEAMAGQAGAPSKVEDKICGTGWNGLERSKSKFFDMWAKRPIMSDINFLGNFGRHPNFHNICLFESSDKG